MFDVVIVGGGPAGLSAALILGRSRRRVLVLDSGSPRNAPASHSHGYLTQDGVSPVELLNAARRDLEPYSSVEVRAVAATSASATAEGFAVELADGSLAPTRKVILASGVGDVLPPIPGLAELWGKLVHHCPYCHGWELRDERIGILGMEFLELRLPLLRGWSASLVVFGDGEPVTPEIRDLIESLGAELIGEPVERLTAVPGGLSVALNGDAETRLAGIYVLARQEVRSPIASALGCEIAEVGPLKSQVVVTDAITGQSTVEGVYAVGDIMTAQHALPLAVASGTRAAYALNHALAVEDAATFRARVATA